MTFKQFRDLSKLFEAAYGTRPANMLLTPAAYKTLMDSEDFIEINKPVDVNKLKGAGRIGITHLDTCKLLADGYTIMWNDSVCVYQNF